MAETNASRSRALPGNEEHSAGERGGPILIGSVPVPRCVPAGSRQPLAETLPAWLTCILRPSFLLIAAAVASPARAAQPDDEPVMEPEEETDDEPLPTIDKMELPAFGRLMKGPAIDWIVMHSKKVLVVEPVVPRPGTL